MKKERFVSLNGVIESLYRDAGYTHQVNISDCVEWAGEAIDLIGIKSGFVEKVTGIDSLTPTIAISNYRGELPCDYYKIIQAREYCTQQPMRYTTDSFHHANKSDRSVVFTTSTDYTYSLNDNYIFTSFEEGEVEMSYLAYPIDSNGWPMVLDTVKYIRAIKSYLQMKEDYKLWRSGKLQKGVFDDSEQEWYLNCAAAEGEGKMPTLDKMESIKNSYLRLIPKIEQHSAGFVYNGQMEQRYIK